jgi:hypothetical protein
VPVNWREGLKRSATVTARGYLIAAVIMTGAYAYSHGRISQQHFYFVRDSKPVDVSGFSGAEAEKTLDACTDPNPFAKFDPNRPDCGEVGHPERALKAKMDWDLAATYAGRMTAYLLITYAIFWVVFRGLRWTLLGFVEGPDAHMKDRFGEKRRSV